MEYSLSVDNIFVFVVVLKYFRVPAKYQHRVLFFGILGALVFRGLFIAPGRDAAAFRGRDHRLRHHSCSTPACRMMFAPEKERRSGAATS